MKKIIISFITILIGLNCVLGQNSNVILYTENGERFSVILNGIRQNASAETNVKITDLNAPSYSMKIIFKDQTLGTISKTIYFNEPGEYTYVIINKKGEYKVRFRTSVPIAQAPPPPAHQNVIVYTTTQPASGSITQTTTSTTTSSNVSPHGDNVSLNVNIHDGGMGINMNININDGTHMTGTSTTTTTTTTTSTTGHAVVEEHHHHDMPGYNGAIGCPWPMSNQDFAGVKNSISSKSFEDSKLTMAKQVINSNCMFSQQVKEIMTLFSFEDTKLDLAKYAYGHTFDLGNYYKVNDAFNFESSIDELNEYIKSHGR